ncbi:MAG: hypothetical protein Q9191_006722 [Dirinaria sp. TL-2023a]
MSKSPYKNYEGASQGLDIASKAAGATTAIPNPMSGIQNAQQAYHTHQYGKIRKEGMQQALANEERAKQRQREMETQQVQDSEMTYGVNGITEDNGFVKSSEGKISYAGGKK